MNYINIIQALPSSLAAELLENLDNITVSSDGSRSEMFDAMNEAADATKRGPAYLAIADAEKRRMVDLILEFLPQAGTKAILD